jgi:hypothetical protein
MLDAAGTAAKVLPTNASRAQEFQDEADRIYEQQRFASCKLDVTQCSK